MAPIAGDWQEALKGEFHQPYYAKLYKTVMTEYRTRKIFPPPEDMFNAFHFTPLHQVKVVILGQDPYHNDGQAHGLCFSVKKGVETPPSLVNIYKELEDDMGCYIPNNGNLEKWAKPKRVPTPLSQFPSRSFICKEPYGVTLVMSPWNYPFLLSLDPLIGSIAAGNCVILKPSAYAPHIAICWQISFPPFFPRLM